VPCSSAEIRLERQGFPVLLADSSSPPHAHAHPHHRNFPSAPSFCSLQAVYCESTQTLARVSHPDSTMVCRFETQESSSLLSKCLLSFCGPGIVAQEDVGEETVPKSLGFHTASTARERLVWIVARMTS